METGRETYIGCLLEIEPATFGVQDDAPAELQTVELPGQGDVGWFKCAIVRRTLGLCRRVHAPGWAQRLVSTTWIIKTDCLQFLTKPAASPSSGKSTFSV